MGGGEICPPIWRGQVQGDKALMGGRTHEGGHRPYGGGGGLTLIDYIIN